MTTSSETVTLRCSECGRGSYVPAEREADFTCDTCGNLVDRVDFTRHLDDGESLTVIDGKLHVVIVELDEPESDEA